jgi:replicative DNA helicase
MEGSTPATAERIGYRAPPHNFEAEMAVLGAILTNNRAFDRVGEFLAPEHFIDRRHGRIFAAIKKLMDAGGVADPVTLKGFFESDGTLEEIGGAAYLVRLAQSVVSVVNAEDYGRIVLDRHLRRELIGIGEEVVNRAHRIELETSATDQIEMAEQSLYELATAGVAETDFVPFTKALTAALHVAEAAHKREGGLAGVPTHLRTIDEKLGGLHPSDLIILAGRPGMGKTALATNIALYAAAGGIPNETTLGERKTVAFFSLEMSAEQLATRIVAEQTGISSDKIRRGRVPNEEFGRIVEQVNALSYLPLFIDDTAALTVSALRTRARRLKRRNNLALIVVDYLQLLRSAPNSRAENRVLELSEITRSLKVLAKELEVPVVALSQLSRAVESRDDKRPQLSDLRESGSIEQDADVVMFIYREEYYLKGKEPDQNDTKKYAEWMERMEKVHNLAEIIIAKQRHGPTGAIRLHFEHTLTRFRDLAAGEQLPERID